MMDMNSADPQRHPVLATVPRQLQRHDYLALPRHQRVIPQYQTNLDGTLELRLNFGNQELAFDTPELFEFGEALARHAMFRAESAVSWGVAYQWNQISELLKQLLDRGILHYASPDHDAPVPGIAYIGARDPVHAGLRMEMLSDASRPSQSQ